MSSLSPDQIRDFVGKAHADIDYVRAALAQHPSLVDAAWDWGDGDWETGLGAASHIGRRDIAELLIEHGGEMTIFAAAMLGDLETVKSILARDPKAIHRSGSHGIPLDRHAFVGGRENAVVVKYLARYAEGMTAE